MATSTAAAAAAVEAAGGPSAADIGGGGSSSERNPSSSGMEADAEFAYQSEYQQQWQTDWHGLRASQQTRGSDLLAAAEVRHEGCDDDAATGADTDSSNGHAYRRRNLKGLFSSFTRGIQILGVSESGTEGGRLLSCRGGQVRGTGG